MKTGQKFKAETLWKDHSGIRQVVLHDANAKTLFDFIQTRRGMVYIMINPVADKLLKIGRTAGNPFLRAETLKTAGALGHFEPVWIHEFCNVAWAEARVHDLLKETCHDREWFSADLDVAKAAIQSVVDEENQLLALLGGQNSLLRQSFEDWMASIDLEGLIESEF